MTKKIFGTEEWAVRNENFIDGCIHDCKYCYAKSMAIRFKRKTFANWKDESIREHNFAKKIRKAKGTVMFPSSHDIHPEHLPETLIFLEKIVKAGNKVLIVSKPHLECIKAICEKFADYKNQILFRFTIGSHDSSILKFWEPGASDFNERVECLKYSFEKGFKTSVSCEPMLDNEIEKLIDKILPYVTDAIWIGKANNLIARLKLNGFSDDEETMQKAQQLINALSESRIKAIYEKYKDDEKIKWKESIKEILGLNRPKEKGLDV